MIATGHIAVGFGIGVVVAQRIKSPVIGGIVGFSAGVISHYITDFIPHGHIVVYENLSKPASFPLIFLDVFVGGLVFLIATCFKFRLSLTSLVVLITMAGSLLVDVVDALLYYTGNIPPPSTFLGWQYHFHKDILHWHGGRENSLPIGWYDIWQLAIIVGMLIAPFRLQLSRLRFFLAKEQPSS